jgi:hypothetical protein
MKKAVRFLALSLLLSVATEKADSAPTIRQCAITAAAFVCAIPVGVLANKKLDWSFDNWRTDSSNEPIYFAYPSGSPIRSNYGRIHNIDKLQVLAGIVGATAYGIDWMLGGALFPKKNK